MHTWLCDYWAGSNSFGTSIGIYYHELVCSSSKTTSNASAVNGRVRSNSSNFPSSAVRRNAAGNLIRKGSDGAAKTNIVHNITEHDIQI